MQETDSSTILKCSTLLARAHWAINYPVIVGTHNDRDCYFNIANHEWDLIMFFTKTASKSNDVYLLQNVPGLMEHLLEVCEQLVQFLAAPSDKVTEPGKKTC